MPHHFNKVQQSDKLHILKQKIIIYGCIKSSYDTLDVNFFLCLRFNSNIKVTNIQSEESGILLLILALFVNVSVSSIVCN